MHEWNMRTARLVTAVVCVIVALLPSAAPAQPAAAGATPTLGAPTELMKLAEQDLPVITRSSRSTEPFLPHWLPSWSERPAPQFIAPDSIYSPLWQQSHY